MNARPLAPGYAVGPVRFLDASFQGCEGERYIFVCTVFSPLLGWLLSQYGCGLIIQEASELSHAALLSRELGIPCVSEYAAFGDLLSAQQVAVNGTDGIVELYAQ
jgi:phosphoenolpyruvate-protein kinase (PTS system EI component)